ncbi:MAG: OmpL47-type beta-barrel domain-containing protein, partial [Promethearchaeia archaeon]
MNRKSKFIICTILIFTFIGLINHNNYNINHSTSNSHNYDSENEYINNPTASSAPDELWTFSTGGEIQSSTAVVDLNKDGIKEVIFGSNNGKIYALHGNNGSEFWEYSTGDEIRSSPAISDLNGDGFLDVVVGSRDNNVYALHGINGTKMWDFTTSDWVDSSPAIADINNDGTLEVVIGSDDNNIYALHGANGTKMWEYTTGDGIEASPAIGDINSDNFTEIVIGSKDSNVYTLSGKNGSLCWSYSTDEKIQSSPALGDINEDGKMEVVIGSYDNNLYILYGENGSQIWNFDAGGSIDSSPALGDVNQDGTLDIVFGTKDECYKVYAIDATSRSKIWEHSVGFYVEKTSPTLGDINGDGDIEVLIGNNDDKLYALDGNTGDELWTYNTGHYVRASAALTDLNNDQDLEIIFGSLDSTMYILDLSSSAGDNHYWQGLVGDSNYQRHKNLNNIRKPEIDFEISDRYLNTTNPLETDKGLQINCSVSNSSNLNWVYLSENSTGSFTNRSMKQGVNGEWSLDLNISSLERGTQLSLSFSANSSENFIINDNNGLNFSILIGDFLPPYSNISYNKCDSPNYISNSTSFTLSGEDNQSQRFSGISNISYKIDGEIWRKYTVPFNLSGFSHGNHTIYYYATDNAGNEEPINQTEIFLDVQAPNVTFGISHLYLNTTNPQYNQSTLQINCTVKDNTTLSWVYLCENSTGTFVNRSMNYISGNYSYLLDISNLNWSDTISFFFYANDSAANIGLENNGAKNYSLQIYDFQEPQTKINYTLGFAPNYVNESTEFSFFAEDNVTQGGSGIGNITYRIDSGDWKLYENPFNLSEYGEGEHTIFYNSTDLAGNTEEIRNCTLYLDINNITSSIIYDPFVDSNVKYVNETQKFNFNWNDGTGSGLNNLYYRIDSEAYARFSGAFNLTGYAEGEHTIYFYTIDNVGNQEPVKSTKIYLDLEAPDISLDYQLLKEPNYLYESDLIQIVPGNDERSGTNVVQYRIEDGDWNNQSEFSLEGFNSRNYTIYY